MHHLIALGLVAAASTPALAQPRGYYGAAPRQELKGGFHNRQGRLAFGGSLGLGGMSDRGGDINCTGCDYNPLAVGISAHLGGFIGPHLALMGELQGNAQTLASDRYSGDTTTLVQGALMIAAQGWLTPQLWVKAGVGFAELHVDESYYGDGIIDASSKPEHGVAVMGAVGYEVLSAPFFSIDIEGRLLNGSYKSLDNNITAGTIGIGINWY